MTSVLEPAGSAVSPILAVTRSTALQQESRLPGRLTQPAPNSHSNKMADAGEATGHLPLGPAHSICARAELDSTPTAEALPLTSLGAANQECVRESPCVSHSCGLPRSGRRQRVRPFLTAKQPPSGCVAVRPLLLGRKTAGTRGNSVLKICFWEQSVEWWRNVWPGRRGPQMIASQKALINQVA